MPARESRRSEQQLARRKRRRSAGLIVIGFAAIAGIGVATHHGKHASARAALAAPKRHVTALAPTPPIPGYLLIADRRNGRMLLVDSAKHVFWQYPAPGKTPAMPFRFDDDTF